MRFVNEISDLTSNATENFRAHCTAWQPGNTSGQKSLSVIASFSIHESI